MALALVLPIALHYDATRGYFEDDDFGSLNWARYVPLKSYVRTLPCVIYPCEHARPTGYAYYGAIFRFAGLNYAPWVIVLQCIGLINVVLLWLLMRRIGADAIAAAAGCLFFVCARPLFDAWWKPIYVYDVLCTTFALASILAYAHGRWILSFIAFWLAVRSKEMGIVIPAVLLCYEMTLGRRNWKRVIPFFVPAILYAGSGLVWQARQPLSPYTPRFTFAGLWKSFVFYSWKLFHWKFGAVAFAMLALVIRDRRLYFAMGAAACELAVYLLLPDRLLEVYLYLTMTAVAIAIAVLATRYRRVAVPLVLVWVVWQGVLIRKQAPRTLAEADERREFVAALANVPDARTYVYVDSPESFHFWGAEYALRVVRNNIDAVYRLHDPDLPGDRMMPLLVWNPQSRRIDASNFSANQYSFLDKSQQPPSWQVRAADRDAEGYRPVRDVVRVRLYRPAGDARFSWEACGDQKSKLWIWIDGKEVLPNPVLEHAGCEVRSAPVSGDPRMVTVTLRAAEIEHVKIGSLGFEPRSARVR